MRSTRLVQCIALFIGLAATGAAAQTLAPSRDQVPLEDLLEILLLERQVVAIDAEGGGQTTAELRLKERVVWSGTRGVVGVVLTDQRILAVSTLSAAWQEADYQRREQPPEAAALGDRVALMVTSQRALGFNAGSGNLVEYRFGPNEALQSYRVGSNVAVVVTDRKALGLSPSAGGFFEVKLQLYERIEKVEVRANLATVTTGRRVLIFRAPTGSWSERRLDLDS
jgi:hypothetical protein